MKTLSLCLLFFLLCVASLSADSGLNLQKRYPKSKSGIIKYEITGTKTGTEVVYYDDWGRREAKYTRTTMELFGSTVIRNTLTLLENHGQWINTIDLNNRTGLRIKNPRYKLFAGKSQKELENTTKTRLHDMGAQKEKVERIAGKNCEVWEKQHTGEQTWTWKGIILKKISVGSLTETTTVATEIIEGIPIPEEKFAIPPDIQVKTVDMYTLHGN
ncbi:MAG: hypothetical protein GY941_21095 [Planctomycetes bacterium]|nr:hypothetical protein [Planctomycetota bacterium]